MLKLLNTIKQEEIDMLQNGNQKQEEVLND